MPSLVRVIGRVDLAAKIRDALRSAGVDADVVTAGPMSAYGGEAPAGGVDVVVATSLFDLSLWTLAKRKRPARPMLAVAEARRERSLRGAIGRRYGPDAYVTWPATPEALLAGVHRAEAAAGRKRAWSVEDVAAGLIWTGLVTANVAGGLGVVIAGIGLLLGARSAWNLPWQVTGGVVLTVMGAAGVAEKVVRVLLT